MRSKGLNESKVFESTKATLADLKTKAEERRSQKILEDLAAEKARLEAEIAKYTR